MLKLITRFAPSPTGKLHIGGVRTALYNFLLAKKFNGSFILRIEDTDTKRNYLNASKDILEGLKWLKLTPDESFEKDGKHGPYLQSQRTHFYYKIIEDLLNLKKAYYCFCTKESLEEEKSNFIYKNNRKNYQYSKKCLSLNSTEIYKNLEEKKPYVIRFLVNQKDIHSFDDGVRGKITFDEKDIEDFILIRNNLEPLLNFSVVVDDHLMEITHIIRGQEHLTNTFKQILIYKALNWEIPIFFHLSVILDKNKKKISKRNVEGESYRPQFIEFLKEDGYLPEAVVNYLLLLGWHPGNTQEFFSIEEAIKNFNYKNFQKSDSIFDIKKLDWFNNYYIKNLNDEQFNEKALKTIEKISENIKDYDFKLKIVNLFKKQLNNFKELLVLTKPFFTEPEVIDLSKEEKDILKSFKTFFLNETLEINLKSENYKENIKKILDKFINKKQIEKGKFFIMIRKIILNIEKGSNIVDILSIFKLDKLNYIFNKYN